MVDFDVRKVKWLKGYRDLPTAYYPLKVPGITTILNLIPDPDLDKFIADVGEVKAKQIMEAAGHRGTAMHGFMEHFVKELAKTKDPSMALLHTQRVAPPLLKEEGIPMDKIDKGRDMFFNFYYSDYSNTYMDLIGTELPVYSPTLYYRGLIDVFYRMNGNVVTDFKTSSKPIEKGTVKELKYKRQIGAYALAVEHMLKDQNTKVNRASILVVQTKSEIIQEIWCEGEELEEQKREFETLVRQWHTINNQEFLFNG